MRLDGGAGFQEEREVYSYQPQWYALGFGLRHSGLYHGYHSEAREDMLESLAGGEPELAFVIACVGEMGLFGDCAEVEIWRDVCARLPKEALERYRNIMPGIVKRIRECPDGDDFLREMYFSKVLPVVAASDAGERRIARLLLVQAFAELEQTYG